MPNPKKIESVELLTDRIARSTVAIAASYQGLTVAEMGTLRRQLREAEVELRVIKNRLFRIATQAAGIPEMAELAEGPTAVAFGYGEITVPARALTEYMRAAKNAFALRRGYAAGQLLSAREVEELATLPSREALIARVSGAVQAPVAHLAQLLAASMMNSAATLFSSTVAQLQGLLQARAAQQEGA
jgi:large subunit ribosomal protein L10